MTVLATVTGTALVPGISRNKRLYTPELIRQAVERAQARISDGGLPLTTLTHHGGGDDSTRIVGRLTRMWQEQDGSAKYEAVLADTRAGRDILALVSGPNPVLRGVSIRGAWLGKVRKEQHDGQTVECGDSLELSGLDYTSSPGVTGARIERVEPVTAAPRESYRPGRTLVRESAPDAALTFGETAEAQPLHEMSAQEFREHSRRVWGVLAETMHSPAWRGREPMTISEFLARGQGR